MAQFGIYDGLSLKRKGSRSKAVSFKNIFRLPLSFKKKANEVDPKSVVAPLQFWLLKQQRCVGCGRPLKNAAEIRKNGTVLVKCSCLRIFVYDPERDSYRRALFEEII